MGFINKVQLISYPDSLGGNLKNLRETILKYFPGCFSGGIHVLPPYPSSGDRGFAPITYSEIDPRFGDWNDIASLNDIGPVMLDLMVNHVSRRSSYFMDFLQKGRNSAYANYFIDISQIWPEGEPDAVDLEMIFRRRPFPYSEYVLATGEKIRLWTTFGHEDPSEQIDLNFESPDVMRMIINTMEMLHSRGVSSLRLDAVGYIIKRRGTSCFFVEPEIWDVMGRIRDAAEKIGMDVLPEVHAPIEIQKKLTEKGYWTYDFILPFLILEAVLTGSGVTLASYLRDRPSTLFTMLDCHDGIPIKPDLDGFVSEAAARKIADICLTRGANFSKIQSRSFISPGALDIHQIRCTFYSALGKNEDAHVIARAIQLFVPGIPQVYYVGLLAGENDQEEMKRTGDGRGINRHNYTMSEINELATRSVVKRTIRLLQLRNEHPAFNGKFSINTSKKEILELMWEKGSSKITLSVNLGMLGATVEILNEDGTKEKWKV